MNIQTYCMIKQAGDEKEFVAAKDGEQFYGTLFVNHPPPSGGERYMLVLSDNRRFKDEEEAVREFKKRFEEIMEEVTPKAEEMLAEIRGWFS